MGAICVAIIDSHCILKSCYLHNGPLFFFVYLFFDKSHHFIIFFLLCSGSSLSGRYYGSRMLIGIFRTRYWATDRLRMGTFSHFRPKFWWWWWTKLSADLRLYTFSESNQTRIPCGWGLKGFQLVKLNFLISSMHRAQHNPDQLPCTVPGCLRWFKSHSRRTKHIRSLHACLPTLPQSLSWSSTPVVNDADEMFDMSMDGADDVSDAEGAGRRSNSLPVQPGSQSSSPPSIGCSPPPNNNISLNYHSLLDGEFSSSPGLAVY